MDRRQALRTLALVSSACWIPRRAFAKPPVGTDGLGAGRYARMHVFLEKTIFDFDVLDLELRYDQGTADLIAGLVKGRKYSAALANRVVATACGATDAYAGLQFLRDFELDDFIDGIRLDLGRAYQGKLIDQAEYSRMYWGLPDWFSFLRKRGIKSGDKLYERARPSGLQTVFIDVDGAKRLDMHLDGAASTRTLVATYLAPGGELRDYLVQSLFDS
jgi:hypothetical protein